MASMTASVGKQHRGAAAAEKQKVYSALCRLAEWLEKNRYEGYDTFDGLNSPLLRPLTCNSALLRMVLQQGIRRFPINLRPLVGIAKSPSTKGMGFIARGYLRLYESTLEARWREKAESALKWLMDHQAPGYSGACWGNHFDYQSRCCYVTKGIPSVVWTALIGHVFLDAWELLRDERYLRVAVSACEHIVLDLPTYKNGDAVCIGYFPTTTHQVHNASTLGASFLARTYSHTRNQAYRELAARALHYTARHQRPDHSWFYGEADNLHWVDNFHTAYVLDSFKYYSDATGEREFETNVAAGYHYWKSTFFLADGTPRYYDRKTLPLDIQCCSQAIDTLVFFADRDPEAPSLALKVALWTISQMQDPSGYFYYRRYSRWLVNRTPTLHWGQATMLSALAALYKVL
jgi:hypothetical protein